MTLIKLKTWTCIPVGIKGRCIGWINQVPWCHLISWRAHWEHSWSLCSPAGNSWFAQVISSLWTMFTFLLMDKGGFDTEEAYPYSRPYGTYKFPSEKYQHSSSRLCEYYSGCWGWVKACSCTSSSVTMAFGRASSAIFLSASSTAALHWFISPELVLCRIQEGGTLCFPAVLSLHFARKYSAHLEDSVMIDWCIVWWVISSKEEIKKWSIILMKLSTSQLLTSGS